MRTLILFLGLSVSLAQSQPNCNGAGLHLDVRCACVKDPSSKLCEMVRAGFYDPNRQVAFKPIDLGLAGKLGGLSTKTQNPGTARQSVRSQPARPRQARVVALAHKDYLRFLHPNAHLAAGGAIPSTELTGALFGAPEGDDGVAAALREMDYVWLSVAPGHDVVLLMTGRFEQGAAAGMFYRQGVYPVFLGGAQAMLIGPEPSVQSALGRLARPAGPSSGWVQRRAREMSREHETWIVSERSGAKAGGAVFQHVRQFALGIRLTGEAGISGEALADSEAGAEGVAAWIHGMKTAIRNRTGVGALDSLEVERTGATVRFRASGGTLLQGEAGKTALRSDFGVELHALMMGSFPGVPVRTVAEDKLLAVKVGMKREDVLDLLGQPLSVYSIQGLETPRETWTYQIPFGKQYTTRLEGGVVAGPVAAAH